MNLVEKELGLKPQGKIDWLASVSSPVTKAALRVAMMTDPSGETAQAVIAEYRRGVAEGLKAAKREEAHLKRSRDALTFMADLVSDKPKIGPAKASNMSKAMNGAFSYGPYAESLAIVKSSAAQAFLIQHDWAAIFDGTDLAGADFILPADQCCFEFSINGADVCVFLFSEDGEPRQMIPVWKTPHGWFMWESFTYDNGTWIGVKEDNYTDGFSVSLDRIIRASCIALDADVIEKETVKADPVENERREKRGVVPINDHVILKIRRRASSGNGGNYTGGKRRLHFRRGHWRRYAESKSWVRWCMVGDASLGFRDKDYAL